MSRNFVTNRSTVKLSQPVKSDVGNRTIMRSSPGEGVPYLSDLQQKLFINIPYFNAGNTEIVDGKGTENFDLVESNCLYKNETAAYFEFQEAFLLDSDFKIEFYVMPDAVTATASLIMKYGTNGMAFYPFRTAGSLKTQILLKGTSKSATFTDLELLSTTAYTKVTIERVSSNLLVKYDDILKATISLTAYGSIEEATKLRIYPGLTRSYNYNVYQGLTHLAHLPCSEGTHSSTTLLFNSVGNDWTYNSSGYSNYFNNISQNNYHYNLQNGFSLYYDYLHTMYLWLPYRNGIPQVRTGLQYSGTAFIKIGDYPPGFNSRVETKVRFKTNLLNLTDTTLYFDASHNPKGVKFKDLSTLEGKIFVNKSKALNPTILTYSTEKTEAQENSINTYLKNKPAELWIIAGQSNAYPGANLSGLTRYNAVETQYGQVWNIVSSVFNYSNYVIGNHENPIQNVAFGITTPLIRLRSNAHRQMFVVQYAVNGSCIYNDGTANNWNTATVGGYYSNLLTYINAAKAKLEANNVPYIFKGIIWFQGESDASILAYSQAFKQNTLDFLNGVRVVTGNVPIFLGRICNVYDYSTPVRARQLEISQELSSCYLIDTDPMPHEVDNIHLNAEGKMQFAEYVNNLLG